MCKVSVTCFLLLAAASPWSRAQSRPPDSANNAAQASSGVINGITRDAASGQPLATAQIIAHNTDTGIDQTAVSGADGSFAIANLRPGRYEMAVTKDGFVRSSAHVDVAAPGTCRVDFLLASARQETAANALPAALIKEIEALKKRVEELEAREKEQPRLLATIAKDPSQIPFPPGTLGKNTLASNVVPPSPFPAPGAAPQPGTPAAPAPAHVLPEALEAPDATPGVDNVTPFAYADFTWLNGNPRNKDTVLDTKFFTPEVRFDTHFMQDFNQPKDHSMGGATESFRSGEFQVEQISVGGDFHWQNVRGRILDRKSVV